MKMPAAQSASVSALFLCLSGVLASCGGTAMKTAAPAVSPASAEVVPVAVNVGNDAAPMRVPGDFAVYRISGSYREAPVSITQRLVARSEGVMVLDMTIEDGGSMERLRLRVEDGPEHRGDVLSVAKLEGGVMTPFGVAAYERRMSELVPAADDNEGEIGKTGEVVKVGVTRIPCVRTEYRVRFGAHRGVMSTLSAEGFPWDNLGGRVVAEDGSVFYNAQLVELGNRQPSELDGKSRAGIAATEEDLYDVVE
jgi:hypothetical protein